MIGKTNPCARGLRLHSTKAERLLWRHLRNRQIAGLKFRRQATIGPYVVDFLCVEARLVVEADGGQHSPEGDAARTQHLEQRGLQLLRFWNNDILQNLEGVLSTLATSLDGRAPSPNPLPPAGEG